MIKPEYTLHKKKANFISYIRCLLLLISPISIELKLSLRKPTTLAILLLLISTIIALAFKLKSSPLIICLSNPLRNYESLVKELTNPNERNSNGSNEEGETRLFDKLTPNIRKKFLAKVENAYQLLSNDEVEPNYRTFPHYLRLIEIILMRSS